MKTSEIRERMIVEKKNFELMKKTSFEFRLENFWIFEFSKNWFFWQENANAPYNMDHIVW